MGVVFRKRPKDFSPYVEAAGCYISVGDRLLFLKRASKDYEGDKWGVPAGKIKDAESAKDAVVRECLEETGIFLPDPLYLGPLFFRMAHGDYVFHVFHSAFESYPEVSLNKEHSEFCWAFHKEAKELPLMAGAKECLLHFEALSILWDVPRKPFYFIRHGETAVNADPNHKRVDYDGPLNERGRLQAREARNIVQNLALSEVFHSPIARAVETKEILLEGLTLQESQIAEIGECKAATWNAMVGNDPCTEKEVIAFFARTVKGLVRSLDSQAPLLVSHGGVHYALCYLLGIQEHPWKIGNCRIVEFYPVEGGGWEARYHLPSLEN